MSFVIKPLLESRERLPALALAVLVTVLVFAAINAGFTPHGVALLHRSAVAASLTS
jgi:hypothetical protein